MLTTLLVSVNAALETLREITRGVFPAQLARSGLPAALASLVATSERRRVASWSTTSAAGRRFPPRVEAAAYFCAAEATRDLDEPVVCVLSVQGEHLALVVTGTRPGRDRRGRHPRPGGGGGRVRGAHDRPCGARSSRQVQLTLDHTSSSRSGPNAALLT